MLSAGAETDVSARRRFADFATPVPRAETRATARVKLATREAATNVQNWSILFQSPARRQLRTAFVLIGSASQFSIQLSRFGKLNRFFGRGDFYAFSAF